MSDDWTEVLSALSDAGARFLVVGAHAMAVHGVPRGTQDLDVWIDPTGANAERVWRGLAAFGASRFVILRERSDRRILVAALEPFPGKIPRVRSG